MFPVPFLNISFAYLHFYSVLTFLNAMFHSINKSFPPHLISWFSDILRSCLVVLIDNSAHLLGHTGQIFSDQDEN